MRIKNIFKIILLILISSVLLAFLSDSKHSEATELNADTSYDSILASIDNILEKNEKYEYIDKTIKNINVNTTSYKLRIFGKENNDRQIQNDSIKRVDRIMKIINLHKINFLNYNFNLI